MCRCNLLDSRPGPSSGVPPDPVEHPVEDCMRSTPYRVTFGLGHAPGEAATPQPTEPGPSPRVTHGLSTGMTERASTLAPAPAPARPTGSALPTTHRRVPPRPNPAGHPSTTGNDNRSECRCLVPEPRRDPATPIPQFVSSSVRQFDRESSEVTLDRRSENRRPSSAR